jgi:hypothetical protein
MVSRWSWLRAGAWVLGIAALAGGFVALSVTKNGPAAGVLIPLGVVLLLLGQPWLELERAGALGFTFRRVVRLEIALEAGPDGLAKGDWTPYGQGGEYAYFYHLIVRTRGSEGREVWVKVLSVHKPSEGPNTLGDPVRLRKYHDNKDPSPGSVSGYGVPAAWNLGFLANPKHLNQFQLDVYESDWPLNFQGIVREGESLRVSVLPVAVRARAKPLWIDIQWDGRWFEKDAENMKEHCKVKVTELRRRRWPRRSRAAAGMARSTA